MTAWLPTEGLMVWAKVGRDPWWPAAVLPKAGGGWERKDRQRRRVTYRCLFLQPGYTQHQWLPAARLRPFRPKDCGDDRPAEYVTTIPR
jgi:hypothetical protein